MNAAENRLSTESESRKLAEASREKEWTRPGFLRELFLGRLRLDLIQPYPVSHPERPEFLEFYERLKAFLLEAVDPEAIDRLGDYPPEVLDGLRRLGAFGMKIPKEYGGLELDQVEYGRVMQLLGSYDGNLTALLSAHQSIGVPQPLKLFGTVSQKRRYLPRCAAGEISAFALTEPQAGSDPARLSTTAERSADGKAYILNGEKLWCTNGTLARLLVVMARHPGNRRISAFIVETDWEGVRVEGRCHFMGLRALANAVISFQNVRVPVENLIGEEGRGLKIALTTLNDGRLSIPNSCVGIARKCLEICRRWSGERVQWGKPIGRHEAIAHRIADMAATTFAMESMVRLATELSARGEFDIRLEAAAAKEWSTARGWEIVDDTMQVRGGRGYESADSLQARGEEPIPVERLMRDFRINRIFEGSSEIMHLFMAREAVDPHLQLAGTLADRGQPVRARLAALPRAALFYLRWYPTRWLGWPFRPRFARFSGLAIHLRFVERSARKLSRELFHGILAYGSGLERKQAFLFRLVDICNELFVMTASICRAQEMRMQGHGKSAEAARLADLACRNSRRRVAGLFHGLWHNDDACKYRLALSILDDDMVWLEEGALSLLQIQAARPARGHPEPHELPQRRTS